MNSFDERQKGYENKFAHDLEVDFKVRSKRNKYLGLWAAEKMGYEGEKADKYAIDVVSSVVDGCANQAVLNRIVSDLRGNDIEINEQEVLQKMQELLTRAKEEFK